VAGDGGAGGGTIDQDRSDIVQENWRDDMKKLAFSVTVATLIAGAAFAGGLAEPVMEEEVVAEAAGTSAAGIIVPIILLLLIAVAVSGGDDPVPQD
jgi:C4-dicarboxylate transporter